MFVELFNWSVIPAYSYTAVGVFGLDRMFHEAWGKEAPQMQAEFNDYLQVFHTQGNFPQEIHAFGLLYFHIFVFLVLGSVESGREGTYRLL